MKRSLWDRLFTLVVGLWFVAVAAGPELTHACPTHSAHASAAPADSHADHAPAAAATQVAASHHGSTNSDSSDGAQCTCLGQCCATAPVAVIAARIALVDVTTTAMHDAGLPDYAYVPVAAQHVFPLAHAPPLSA